LTGVHIPVRVVLVAPSHPGNVGASARAMKTMGLTELVLVRPKHFPSEEAIARAAGADDVLEKARVVDALSEAIADCGFVVGATARPRSVPAPALDPRCAAESMWSRLATDRVALVMGPEQSGLTNEDLARCHRVVSIPSNPVFGSLNLAMAVQVLCYELRMASARHRPPDTGSRARRLPLADAAEIERCLVHLEELLTRAGFLRAGHQRQLRLKLRRILYRAELDGNEMSILRGVLAALEPERQVPEGGSTVDSAERFPP
jgi:TrmH family RNA methyltransferase